MSYTVPPAGVSPAGAFYPPEIPKQLPPSGFLADPIDFETGELLSIDQGIDPADAWVITQLRTVRNSGSAVENDGRDFSDVTHISPRHIEILRQELLITLQPAITAKWISAVTVEVETDEDDLTMSAKLRWHNNFTGKDPSRDLPLNQLIQRNT